MTAVPGELLLARDEAKRRLRERLERQWKPGDRLPPVKELAKVISVGQANTHQAVKELVAEGVLVSRRKRGTFVRGGDAVRQLPPVYTPPSMLLGEPRLTSRFENKRVRVACAGRKLESFAQRGVDSVVAQLTAAGVTCEVDDVRADRWEEYLVSGAAADAMLLVNPNTVRALRDRRLPNQAVIVVTTGGIELPPLHGQNFDLVTVDSEQGAYLAGQWMRRALPAPDAETVFLGCAPDRTLGVYEQTSLERLRGFELGWGQPIAPAHQLKATNYITHQAARLFPTYLALSPRPRGVFCASDDLAVGFVYAAHGHQLYPGRDYHLIGFDGQERAAQMSSGPLTTVNVEMTRLCETGGRLLLERLADPAQPSRRLVLGCSLLRGTSAVPADFAGAAVTV